VEPELELMALFEQRGCDAADAHSCQMLGDAFHTGAGVSRDLARAHELYARACEAGNATACSNEGVMSLQSKQPGEATRADDLFTRGCALGSSEACRNLVLMTQQQGEVKDAAAQQALFRQACDRGAAVGCLALYDVLRRKPSEPGQPLELPGLLKRACRFGDAKACEFLDDVSSVAQRQCEGGVAASCGVLGTLLLSQPALEHETTQGLQLLRQACKWGDEKSCKLMEDLRLRVNELTCRSN
jgi:TPR repeat protein